MCDRRIICSHLTLHHDTPLPPGAMILCARLQPLAHTPVQLQKYGYADLFAPLPPEDPLDMLELQAARTGGKGGGGNAAHAPQVLVESEGKEEDKDDGMSAAATKGGQEADDAAAGAWASDSEDGEGGVMGELTNRLAGAALGAAAVAAPGTAARPRPAALAAGLAPMTAAKALMREDTPSSLSSPDALSPSMRELLGKYATSASGAAAAAPSTARRRSTLGGSSSGGAPASPAPAYLSPAFQLAAMEQELQMQTIEAQAAQVPLQQQAGTPPLCGANALAAALGVDCASSVHRAAATAAPEPDGMVLTAMKQTAQKLQDKPGFLEQYRQKARGGPRNRSVIRGHRCSCP